MASTTQYQWSHFQWFLKSLDLSWSVLIFWTQPFTDQGSYLQDPQDLWHVPSQVFQILHPIVSWCLTWIAWEPPISFPLGFSFSPLPIMYLLSRHLIPLPHLCQFVASKKVWPQGNHWQETVTWEPANHALLWLVCSILSFDQSAPIMQKDQWHLFCHWAVLYKIMLLVCWHQAPFPHVNCTKRLGLSLALENLCLLCFLVLMLSWMSWLSQQQVVLFCHHLDLLPVDFLVWLPCSRNYTNKKNYNCLDYSFFIVFFKFFYNKTTCCISHTWSWPPSCHPQCPFWLYPQINLDQ